jgi:transposase
MYSVQLEKEQLNELNRLARDPATKPRTRQRLEMVRLRAMGHSMVQIGAAFGVTPRCVRKWVKAYLAGGYGALEDVPHPGRRSELTPEHLHALRAMVAEGNRGWSAPQLAAWLREERGITISASRLRVHLRRAGLSYKRTRTHVKDKRDREEVLMVAVELETHKRGPMPS